MTPAGWRPGWRGLALILLAGATALIMQGYVGSRTIYAPEVAAKRDSAHSFILQNQLPAGATWNDYGLKGARARILIVATADRLHKLVGAPVQKIYFWIDTLALAAGLIALFFLLRTWAPPGLALSGMLYVAAVLPLTYALHYFHPWDRVSLLIWVILLALLRKGKLVLFAAVLVMGMLVKYDVILLPALYFLASYRNGPARAAMTTAALFLLTVGVYLILIRVFGEGVGQRSVATQVATNLEDFRSLLIWYPPLLALGVPAGLALLGFGTADHFARAAAVFAILMSVPLFLFSNFVEIRAEMPVLILLLPAALSGLARLIGPAGQPGDRGAAVAA